MRGFFHRLLYTPPKPVGNRTLLLLLGVGMGLCGGIIGVASYFVGFVIFPFSILLGVAGGLFAYLLADRMGFPRRSPCGALGALFAVTMYLVHHYVVYLMPRVLQAESSGSPGFPNYLSDLLSGGLGIAHRTGTPAGAGAGFSVMLFTGIVAGIAAIGFAVGISTNSILGGRRSQRAGTNARAKPLTESIKLSPC